MAYATNDAVPATIAITAYNSDQLATSDDVIVKFSPLKSSGGVFDCTGTTQVFLSVDNGGPSDQRRSEQYTPAINVADATGITIQIPGSMFQNMQQIIGSNPIRASLCGLNVTTQILAAGTITFKSVP
jgi:hypothetical protein